MKKTSPATRRRNQSKETRGGKRKSTLPMSGPGQDAFFDDKVQEVLSRWPSLDIDGPEGERMIFPLHAFDVTIETATECSNMDRHADWLWLYQGQRKFMADLLAAVTAYLVTPYLNLTRRVAAAESVYLRGFEIHPLAGGSADQIMKRFMKGICSMRLPPWNEVEKRIKVPVDGERIRKVFHQERKRRLAILALWEPNFKAFRGQNKERIPSPKPT